MISYTNQLIELKCCSFSTNLQIKRCSVRQIFSFPLWLHRETPSIALSISRWATFSFSTRPIVIGLVLAPFVITGNTPDQVGLDELDDMCVNLAFFRWWSAVPCRLWSDRSASTTSVLIITSTFTPTAPWWPGPTEAINVSLNSSLSFFMSIYVILLLIPC